MQNSSINTFHPVSKSLNIPQRVKYSSENELPNSYSKTPGGTLYSTTPEGTRIIYERDLLINLRSSPLSKTPPKNFPYIPGLTKNTEFQSNKANLINQNKNLTQKKNFSKAQEAVETDFEMEL